MKATIEFYGPDFSYDALKFTDSHWVLFEDIDVRNKVEPRAKNQEQRTKSKDLIQVHDRLIGIWISF